MQKTFWLSVDNTTLFLVRESGKLCNYIDSTRLIAQDLRQEQLPGSMGLAFEAEIFLQTWQALTGQLYQRSVVMKIYQLTAVQTVSTARGYLRLATEGDRSILIKWLSAFLSEIDEAVSEEMPPLFSHCGFS